MAKPLAITDSSFKTDVLGAEGAVLVDFWAAWCGPCRMVAPHLDAIADEYEGSLTVAKMDIDANPATPGQYQVFSIPTLMVFKDGEVVKRITGARPKEAIMAEVLPFMDAPAASDDLTKIEGVGPKTAEAHNAAGIKTFKAVCDAGSDKLQAVVSGASLSANASSWAEQAKLAADGNWDALKTLQDALDGGIA